MSPTRLNVGLFDGRLVGPFVGSLVGLLVGRGSWLLSVGRLVPLISVGNSVNLVGSDVGTLDFLGSLVVGALDFFPDFMTFTNLLPPIFSLGDLGDFFLPPPIFSLGDLADFFLLPLIFSLDDLTDFEAFFLLPDFCFDLADFEVFFMAKTFIFDWLPVSPDGLWVPFPVVGRFDPLRFPLKRIPCICLTIIPFWTSPSVCPGFQPGL